MAWEYTTKSKYVLLYNYSGKNLNAESNLHEQLYTTGNGSDIFLAKLFLKQGIG